VHKKDNKEPEQPVGCTARERLGGELHRESMFYIDEEAE